MEIHRRGSAADYGTSSIVINDFTAQWSEQDNALVLSASNINDFHGQSNHDYRLIISKNDIERILRSLSQKPPRDGWKPIEEYLSKCTRALHRLLSISSGLPPYYEPPPKLPKLVEIKK